MYAANYPISNYCRRVNSVFLFFFSMCATNLSTVYCSNTSSFLRWSYSQYLIKIVTLRNGFLLLLLFFTINHAALPCQAFFVFFIEK